MESRLLLAAFSVTVTADSGAGSFRQAILDANAALGLDTISFAISGTGVKSIALTSALPSITDPVIINATTQTGYAGTPLVELNGLNAGTGVTGLTITAGSSTVRGLIINRFKFDGMELSGAGGNVIEGCYIGTTSSGTSASANNFAGIYINNSPNNTIGGSTFVVGTTSYSAGNVISGNNSDGIFVEGFGSTGNSFRGNRIGTRPDGSARVANKGNGIVLAGPNNTVGGTNASDRNIISGNNLDGVLISGTAASGNVVLGNHIGTNLAGTSAVGNTLFGVRIDGADDNTIGGTAVGARNVISGNLLSGVAVENNLTANTIVGNYIGTNAAGTGAVRNQDHGILLNRAIGNVIGGTTSADRNVIAGNAQNGVTIQDSSTGNKVQGNYIGLSATGAALGNLDDGVDINNSQDNVVGGLVAGARNVISANGSDGLEIQARTPFSANATGNLIQGNYIGTNAAGSAALGNTSNGVRLNYLDGVGSVLSNTIGGADPAARNIISGNLSAGVQITGANVSANRIEGNYIGTNAAGSAAVPNGTAGDSTTGVGVKVSSPANFIGGAAAGAGNLISGNLSHGISISDASGQGNQVLGNVIGLDVASAPLGNAGDGIRIADASGTVIGAVGAGNTIARNANGISVSRSLAALADPVGNLITQNSIFENSGLGIDLGTIGPTPNDALDADTGANLLQNFPVVASVFADAGVTSIQGTLSAAASTLYRIELFTNPAAGAFGYGQGRAFLSEVSVTTDAAGNAPWSLSLGSQMSAGTFVTATATDPAGNTSEFSVAQPVLGPAITLTGSAGDDVVRVVRNASDPSLLDIYFNGPTPLSSVPFALIQSFTVNTLGGNDTLITDFSFGQVIPPGGLGYDGGTHTTGDLLRLVGAGAGDAFTVNSTQASFAGRAVNYTGAERLALGAGQFAVPADLAGMAAAAEAGSTVTFAVSQKLASLDISAGAVARLASGGSRVLVTNSLTLAGATDAWLGTLDLGDNDMIVRGGSLASISNQIAWARNGGAWDRPGIATSLATPITTLAAVLNDSPSRPTFAGEPVTPTDVLVKYTYDGDGTLDGRIDIDDYFLIDRGYALLLPGFGNGDFNYSGAINADDYFAIDRAFLQQAGPLAAQVTSMPMSTAVTMDLFSEVPVGANEDVVFDLAPAEVL